MTWSCRQLSAKFQSPIAERSVSCRFRVGFGNVQLFVARAKSSGGLVNLKQFGKVGSERILKVSERKCGNFVVDAGFSREPVKLLQNGCYMI